MISPASSNTFALSVLTVRGGSNFTRKIEHFPVIDIRPIEALLSIKEIAGAQWLSEGTQNPAAPQG